MAHTAKKVVSAVMMAAALLGCSTTRQGRSVEPSGFLGDYEQLEEGGKGQAQLRYVNPSADFRKYDKLMLDSISILAAEGSSLSRMEEDKAMAVAAYLRDALVGELGQDYAIVDAPGPGTMRLRVALTEARGSKVVLDTVTTVIPQARILTTGVQLAVDNSVTTGKARAECELLDSETGERLMAAVDERYGTKALAGSLSRWSDVHDAFRLWAERLRVRLAEARGEMVDK